MPYGKKSSRHIKLNTVVRLTRHGWKMQILESCDWQGLLEYIKV
jgi:hypothetical protein